MSFRAPSMSTVAKVVGRLKNMTAIMAEKKKTTTSVKNNG